MLGRSVRTSQPQGPARIDWSNPITRGLEVWMNGGDKSTYRLSSGLVETPTGLSPKFKGASSTTPLKPFSAVCTGITLFAIVRRSDGLSFNTNLLTGVGPEGGDIQIRFSSTSTLTLSVHDNTYSDGEIATVLTGIAAGTFVVGCLTANYALQRAAGYAGGKLRNNPTVGGVGYSFGPFPTPSLWSNFGGECPLALMFSRELSAHEVKSLSDNPWQIFAPDSKALWVPAAASVSLPTLVQPSSTTSAGAWTATGAGSLHAAINELVPSDTQYISVNSASTTELVLAEAAFPGAANQTLAYRASSTQGSTLTVTLKQGATQIMTRTHALTGTDTLYTQTLTSGEIASIVAGPISCTLTTS